MLVENVIVVIYTCDVVDVLLEFLPGIVAPLPEVIPIMKMVLLTAGLDEAIALLEVVLKGLVIAVMEVAEVIMLLEEVFDFSVELLDVEVTIEILPLTAGLEGPGYWSKL